jgi:hypothetical protein
MPSIRISKISMVNLMCTLTLSSSNNYEEKEIVMKLPTVLDPIQLGINLGSNLTFYKEIKPLELENLLEWRKGGDVTLRWSFRGKGLADVNGRTILLELSDDPTSSVVHANFSQNKWDSIVMKCKLDDKFISEFPLSIPDSFRQKTSPFLNQILV